MKEGRMEVGSEPFFKNGTHLWRKPFGKISSAARPSEEVEGGDEARDFAKPQSHPSGTKLERKGHT